VGGQSTEPGRTGEAASPTSGRGNRGPVDSPSGRQAQTQCGRVGEPRLPSGAAGTRMRAGEGQSIRGVPPWSLGEGVGR
jgi:hypothetical protein